MGPLLQRETQYQKNSLALYITTNPRNLKTAGCNLLAEMAKKIARGDMNFNPHSESMTQIHKAKSRTCFVTFDVDDKERNDIQLLAECKEVVGSRAVSIIETRGGYHVLIKPDQIITGNRKWYPETMQYLE